MTNRQMNSKVSRELANIAYAFLWHWPVPVPTKKMARAAAETMFTALRAFQMKMFDEG